MRNRGGQHSHEWANLGGNKSLNGSTIDLDENSTRGGVQQRTNLEAK